MTLNLGIQPWAFEKPNSSTVRRTSYAPIDMKNSDPEYRALRLSTKQTPYPPNIGTRPLNTAGLLLENPPAKSSFVIQPEFKTDDDYSKMMTRNNKAFYPVVDKDHAKRVLAGGMAVDDSIVNIPPTIEEMFSIILEYKKNINAPDYNYWLGLKHQYDKLIALSKIRKLMDSELAIIENIRSLLIKELETTTGPQKHSNDFNDILAAINSIAIGGGLIYSAVELKGILSRLSSVEFGDVRSVLENVTLDVLDSPDKLGAKILRLTSADALKAMTIFKPSPAVSPPDQISAPGDIASPDPVDIASPDLPAIGPPPIDILGGLVNSLSSVKKTISQAGLNEPVKDILKSMANIDFQTLKSTLGLPDAFSRKSVYNAIANIDLSVISDSLSDIIETSPISIAGVAGLLTTIVNSGGINSAPEAVAGLQNVIGLLPKPELSTVLQVVGLPATSAASAIIPMLSTLGVAGLSYLAITLMLTSLYGKKSIADIKRQFGDRLMPLDFDPSKPNVMLDDPFPEDAVVQDIGLQPGDPWAIPGFDPTVMGSTVTHNDLEEWGDYQLRPEKTEWRLPDSMLKDILILIGVKKDTISSNRTSRINQIISRLSKVKESSNPTMVEKAAVVKSALLNSLIKKDTTTPDLKMIINGEDLGSGKKVHSSLSEWGIYQKENKKRLYDLSMPKLLAILKKLGIIATPKVRATVVDKIISTINTGLSDPDVAVSGRARSIKNLILSENINRNTKDVEVDRILDAAGVIPDIDSDEEGGTESKTQSFDDVKADATSVIDDMIAGNVETPPKPILTMLLRKLDIQLPRPTNINPMLVVLKKYINDDSGAITDIHKLNQRRQFIQLIVDNGFTINTDERQLNEIDNKRGLLSSPGKLIYKP